MPEKILLCFSGGKDSALALAELRRSGDYEVAALLTTVTADYDRVSMHGVRTELLRRQADVLGCRLETLRIARGADNAAYERALVAVLRSYAGAGVTGVAFGDVFLADVRRYREANLAKVSLGALFPLWGRDTAELAETFVAEGYGAVVTCVDSQMLDGGFAGRRIDRRFLADLPAGVDPCGENGEYHSFVYDGPIFPRPVAHVIGEVVVREGRWHYCDVLPA